MRTLYRLILLSLALGCGLAHAQIKVSALPSGTTPVSGDFAICDQSGVTNKCTYSQVAASVNTLLGLGTFSVQNVPTFINGQCLSNNGSSLLWTSCGGSGGNPGGTSGQIQYNNSGVFGGYTSVPIANGGTNATTAAAAMANLLPTFIASDCLSNNGTTLLWTGCGSGGSSAWSGLTSGTNTTMAALVGTGASLGYTGSGVVNANEVNGGVPPTSAVFTGTNSSAQLTAVTAVTALASIRGITPNTTAATSYTYVSADANSGTYFSASTTVTATINAGVFPVGTEITNIPTGGESVVFSAGSGVTLCEGGLFNCAATAWGTSGPNDIQTWKQITSNVWTLVNEPPCAGLQDCTIASGQLALGTAAIASDTCATVQQVFNYYVNSADKVIWSFASDASTVTGYYPASAGSGHLEIYVFLTTQNLNFKVCNWTTSSITAGALTLNYGVVRP